MEHKIYGLIDPSDPSRTIRYVGYTAKSLERRLNEHLTEARKRKCHRHHWLMTIKDRGQRPTSVVLEVVTADNWQERERWWIAHLTQNNLINATSGGEGLINPSAEVRGRISATVSKGLLGNSRRKGIPHSEDDKMAISRGLLGSEAKKLSDSLRRGIPGTPVSEEARAKISASKLGKKRPDMAARMIGNNLGSRVRHTDEFKASVAERNRKSAGMKWITDGSVRKRAKPDAALPDGWRFGIPSRTRTKHTPEAKAKMADARRRHYAAKRAASD